MIDEKKINKAMSSYATETFNHIEERFAAMCGFKEGAEWAQKELIKSLWHDASEEPEDHTDIVYVDEKGNVWSEYDYYADNYDDAFHTGWLSFVNNGVLRVIKWCYLSDILPKEGGEK